MVLVEILFGILGRTAIRLDGDLRESWGRPREHAILATLLIHPGRTVTFSTLIEWAWPGESASPRDPASTLHTHAARLRKSLARLPTRPTVAPGNGGYRLQVDKSLIDYHRFRTLMTQARDHARRNDPVKTAELAEQAINLWRGAPVEDIQSEPAEAWRTRVIHDEWIPAQLVLLEAWLATRQFDQALIRLNDLQADHSLDVNLAKLRISALYGLSRPDEATAYYLGIHNRLRYEADDVTVDDLRRHHETLRNQRDNIIPAQQNRVPRQIPHDVTNFVGRAALLTVLDETVRESRTSGVVIVHGMAGVGKTALVIHWAHRSREHFPDGDFYIDLHGFSGSPAIPAGTVVDDFLITLGHPPVENQTPREKEVLLSQLLADRRALVILDNAASTAHVERLMPLLASCVVVVTSRQRLTKLSRVTGARQVSVPPMSTSEGSELLTVRLHRHRDVNRDIGTYISTLCGGLPLTITILAQHIANRESARLNDFIERLTTRDLIGDIGLDGDGASNTKTFFAWSYRSLATPERRLFRLLGLHPGPDISIEAACACDGRSPAETRESLGILLGAHLLEQPKTFDRYQFHDLLREFALDCVQEDEPPPERAAADLRMIDYYLAAAIQALKTLYPGQLTVPELRTSDKFPPVSFGTPLEAKSFFDRERTTLTAVIAYGAERGNHSHTWRLADTVSTVFNRHGYYEDSRAVLTVAVSSAAAAGDPDGEASSLTGLGMVLTILGDQAEARRCFTAALRFAEQAGHQRGQGATLHQLGRLEMACGNLPEAVVLFRRCLRFVQAPNDDEAAAWTYCRLGQVLRLLDQHDEALVHLHQAQFHAQRIADASALATALAEMGSVFQDRGEHQQAATYCRQALSVVDATPIADLAISVHVCQALAEITNKLGMHDQAYSYARRAIDVSKRTHHISAEARSWEVLAELSFSRGETPDAVNAWRQASELYDRIGNHRQSTIIRAAMRRAQARDAEVPLARNESPTPRRSSSDVVDR